MSPLSGRACPVLTSIWGPNSATPIIYELDRETMLPRGTPQSVHPMSGRYLGAQTAAGSKADGCRLTSDGRNEVSMDAAAGYR